MSVNDKGNLFILQEEFNLIFPYLKLEFSPAWSTNPQLMKKTVNGNIQLEEYRIMNNHDQIVITPQTTVIDLEQKFKLIYGLKMQLFRKSGKVWLETTVTDAWTLEEQNRQGEALSKIVK